MVGRERELDELGVVLAAAARGQGRLFLLAGEAGVGKTSLVEAAVGATQLTFLAAAGRVEGSAPYSPVAAVLRELIRRDPEALPRRDALVAHLAAVVPELGPVPAESDRETLVAALRHAFELIAAREATVVFFDDLQWADAATLELLPLLVDAAQDQPLLILGAYRSDEIPRGHALRRLRVELRRAGRLDELVVEPLDAAASARVAEQALAAGIGPALAAALYDRTLGVPFLVEELAAALAAAGRLREGPAGLELEDGSAVPLPETLRDALRLRADGLSEAGRATLELAAVVGLRIELELVVALGRASGLAEVIDHGLLAEPEPGVAEFRHDLLREAVYKDVHWPRRRALHRDVARALEERAGDPAVSAHHWLAAGESERARPLLVEAARRSCELHAYRDAAAAGRAALEIWPEGEDEAGRIDVLDELGRCAQLCGELARRAARGKRSRPPSTARPTTNGSKTSSVASVACLRISKGRGVPSAAARREAAEVFEATGAAPPMPPASPAPGRRGPLGTTETATGASVRSIARSMGRHDARAGKTSRHARSACSASLLLGEGRREEGLVADAFRA